MIDLLEWIVTSSILILIVVALRTLLRRKIALRARYALWLVVALRLLVPFQLPYSLPAAPVELPSVPAGWEKPTVPVVPLSSQPAEENLFVSSGMLEPGDTVPTETSMGYYQRSEDGETVTRYLDLWSPAQIVQAVWWAGMLAACLVLTVSNLRFLSKLKKRRRPLEIPDCPIPVYAAEGLASPCLFGLFHPAVYLTPEAEAEGARRDHVLAHELTHYAHKDHIWAVVRCLCLAVHWYNPLVWLAVFLSKRDGELACDEGAVARLGEAQRIPYGRTLVDMVAQRPARPTDLLSCSTTMTEGKKTIQQRVSLLVKRPQTVKIALFAAVSVLTLAVVFTFAGGTEKSPRQVYLDQLEAAQAIHCSEPVYSSWAYPSPIADPDLLREAKEVLGNTLDLSAEPTVEEWRDITMAASWITLSGDGENFDQRYGLYQEDNQCCLLFQWSPEIEPTNTAVAVLPAKTLNTLVSLAKEQQERDGASLNRDETPDGSPAARAEAAKWLRVTKNGQECPVSSPGDTATAVPGSTLTLTLRLR